jgi:protein gp37
MGDLFHENVPWQFVHRVFDTMKKAPQHTYLVLTKRPYRIGQALYGHRYFKKGEGMDNVWLMVT